jgi:hypothetical protein
MKSKIEVRVFAVEQAVKTMGVGTPQKDVVAKAQEIEKYIIGEAVLPEVADEASPIDYLNKVASLIGGNADVAAPVIEPASAK